MSNRKERKKNALGITEHPWSSDDEDISLPRQIILPLPKDPPVQNGFIFRQKIHPVSTIESSRRDPTQMERENSWSTLNNSPSRILPSSFYAKTNSMKHTNGYLLPVRFPTSEDMRDRCFRSVPANDVNRTLSFRKISHGINTYRHESSWTATPTKQVRSTFRFKVNSPSHAKRSIFSGTRILESSSSTEEPQPSTSRARDPSPQHLSNNAPLTINLDQSDTDIEQQPQTATALTTAEDDTDGRTDNVDIGTSSSPLMPEEDEVTEVQIIPEVEAVLSVGDSNDDDEQQDDVLQPSDMVATSAAKSKLRTVKRKRDAPDTNAEPYTVKEFNQSLLSLLECPVCLEWMEPPMSQCRRGHLVCSRCRSRLSACPVCRIAFSSVRNRAMEAVADMLRYPCRHGCGREKRLRRRPVHEASCSARRYRCPAPPCAGSAPLPLEELHTHLRSKHPTIVKNGKRHKFSMKMNSAQHDTWLVLTEHEMFHLCIDVDIRTLGVVVYVAYIGPKRNANNFTYEVTVTALHNERKLIYSRVTHSDLESSSLNISYQDCFHLTLDQALNFLKLKNKHSQPDKFLDFYVEISKRDRCESSKEESDTS